MSAWRSTIATALISCTTLAPAAGEQQKPAKTTAAAAPAPVHGFKVVRSYPHDRQAFTQGLEFVDGVLYESTGLNGQSRIRKVNLATGEVLQVQPLDPAYFGEGITVWNEPHHPADVAVGRRIRLRPPDLQQQRTLPLHRAKAGASRTTAPARS